MIDPVPWLARQYADPFVMRAYHHRGPAAAIAAIQRAGGVEHEDGVSIHFTSYHPHNNRRVTLTIGDGEPTTHLMRDILDWAAGRLTDTDWARLDAYRAARDAAHNLAWPTPEDHSKEVFRPAELTPEERARIGAGRRQAWDADRAADALIADRLADRPTARPGEQLELFAS